MSDSSDYEINAPLSIRSYFEDSGEESQNLGDFLLDYLSFVCDHGVHNCSTDYASMAVILIAGAAIAIIVLSIAGVSLTSEQSQESRQCDESDPNTAQVLTEQNEIISTNTLTDIKTESMELRENFLWLPMQLLLWCNYQAAKSFSNLQGVYDGNLLEKHSTKAEQAQLEKEDSSNM